MICNSLFCSSSCSQSGYAIFLFLLVYYSNLLLHTVFGSNKKIVDKKAQDWWTFWQWIVPIMAGFETLHVISSSIFTTKYSNLQASFEAMLVVFTPKLNSQLFRQELGWTSNCLFFEFFYLPILFIYFDRRYYSKYQSDKCLPDLVLATSIWLIISTSSSRKDFSMLI